MENHDFLKSTPTGFRPKTLDRLEYGPIGPWIPD